MTLSPEELERKISEARGTEELRGIFDQLVAEYGRSRASELWWDASAARDASQT